MFFFNDTATTEIYTLSLHDALPIFRGRARAHAAGAVEGAGARLLPGRAARRRARRRVAAHPRRERAGVDGRVRSEEHTSELQSRQYLVCRLLLEKKKQHIHVSSDAS